MYCVIVIVLSIDCFLAARQVLSDMLLRDTVANLSSSLVVLVNGTDVTLSLVVMDFPFVIK